MPRPVTLDITSYCKYCCFVLISGRPLLDSAADAALFVGRRGELDRLERTAVAGLNTVVVGERGGGATSLMHALARRLRDRGGPEAVLVRCGGSTSVAEVLGRFVAALDSAGPGGVSVEELLQQLTRAIAYRPGMVLIVDDLPAVLGAQLLAEYRDTLWVLGAPWVVCVAVDDSATLLAAPGGPFFEVRLDLPQLGRGDVAALLAARGGSAADLDVQELWEAAGGGHPRRVLDVVRAVTSLGNGEVTAAHIAHTAALRELGRPAQALFAELTATGAASASDAALQLRIGWSRVRLQQVLTQLEDSGLVRSNPARPAGGQGRARKVFHPVPATDWFTQQAEVTA